MVTGAEKSKVTWVALAGTFVAPLVIELDDRTGKGGTSLSTRKEMVGMKNWQ